MGLPSMASYALPRADAIPASRARWSLDSGRAALLVHDMQRYFLANFDPAGEPIKPVLANVAGLLARCRALGIPVFYTAQQGNQARADRGLQADFWGPGMQRSPEHEAIVAPLAPAGDDRVLTKHRYSAFQRSNLAELLRARGRDQLVIAGVYAHIGVLATASEAFQRDIQPFVAADAVADFSREKHDMALAVIAASCGVALTSDTIVETLQ